MNADVIASVVANNLYLFYTYTKGELLWKNCLNY